MRIFDFKYLLLVIIFLTVSVSVSANNNDLTSFFNNFEGLNLRDQNGQVFTTNQLDERITLFNFIYTGCVSVCSVQTKELLTVYQSLVPKVRKHIRFVSVSLDPIKDNPIILNQFAQNAHGYKDGWSFISMNFNDLRKLASKITLFREDHGKTIYDQLHAEKNH
jgi:cytochrome oxidase Cu insertion factor (SCO1/SenC/PrrC family)